MNAYVGRGKRDMMVIKREQVLCCWQENGQPWRIVLKDSHLLGWKAFWLETDNGDGWGIPFDEGYDWELPNEAVRELASSLMRACRNLGQPEVVPAFPLEGLISIAPRNRRGQRPKLLDGLLDGLLKE